MSEGGGRAVFYQFKKSRSVKCLLMGTLLALLSTVSADITLAQDFSGKGIGLLDAVRMTLERQPEILFKQQQVEANRGQLQSARGLFDTTFGVSMGRSHESSPRRFSRTLISKVKHDQTDLSLNLSRKFRSGVVIGPQLQLLQSDLSTSPFDISNTGRLDFVVTVPLMRGRGKKSAAAGELYAKSEYDASLFDLRHTISQDVLNTTRAYWGYVAAQKSLDQLEEAENRARRLVRETSTLIEADEHPASDLDQVSANLAAKTASRIAGEQTLIEARQRLGLAMGCFFEEMEILPLPLDEFPLVKVEQIDGIGSISTHINGQSLLHRADYLASEKHQESTKILVEAARTDLKPRVDLDFSIGYSGLDEGNNLTRMATSLQRNVSGVNGGMYLRCELPFENSSARGVLVQRTAAHQQSMITTEDLARNIRSGVSVALSALRSSSQELAKSQEAVRAYRVAVKNEEKKFQMGMATLLDLISTEDRLTNALLNKISAQLKFATALALLRYQSGTIIVTRDDQVSVGLEELTTVPFMEENNSGKSP